MVMAVVSLFTKQMATAGDINAEERLRDRIAVEHVYASHRNAAGPPAAQPPPRSVVAALVASDILNERLLETHYGVRIDDTMLKQEFHRMTTTSRAPGQLADIQRALGYDRDRFKSAIVLPMLVERTLSACFAADRHAQASRRTLADTLRRDMITAGRRGAALHTLTRLTLASPFASIAMAPVSDATTVTAVTRPATRAVSQSHDYTAEAAVQVTLPTAPRPSGITWIPGPVRETPRDFYFALQPSDAPDGTQQAYCRVMKLSLSEWIAEHKDNLGLETAKTGAMRD